MGDVNVMCRCFVELIRRRNEEHDRTYYPDGKHRTINVIEAMEIRDANEWPHEEALVGWLEQLDEITARKLCTLMYCGRDVDDDDIPGWYRYLGVFPVAGIKDSLRKMPADRYVMNGLAIAERHGIDLDGDWGVASTSEE